MKAAPRPARRLPSAAGLTLIEAIVVVGIAAGFVVLLAFAIKSATLVNREVHLQTEAMDLATRVADAFEARAITMVTQPWPLPPADDPTATSLAFMQSYVDAADELVQGVVVMDRQSIEGGCVRFRWMADPNPRQYPGGSAAGLIAESFLERDLNGDGDTTDEYEVGYMTMEFFDAAPSAGGVLQQAVTFGDRGRTRVLWDGGAGELRPIFSQLDDPGTPADQSFDAYDRDAGINPTQNAVQLNLTVLFDPIPGSSGAPETSVFRISRAVSPR